MLDATERLRTRKGRTAMSKFMRALRQFNTLSRKQEDSLVFHMCELLEAIEAVPDLVQAMAKGLQNAKSDSTMLAYAASNMTGEIEHLRYHMRFVNRGARKLWNVAEDMPPLAGMPEEELSRQWMKDSHEAFFENKPEALAKHGLKPRPKRKAKKAARRTSASGVQKKLRKPKRTNRSK